MKTPSIALAALVACAQPSYVRAPVYPPYVPPEPSPPSLPAAQAREREAWLEAYDFDAVTEENCALLRAMDAGVLPEACE